jgi:hypothetical protein
VRLWGFEVTWERQFEEALVDGNAGTRSIASLRHTPVLLSQTVKSVAPSCRAIIGFCGSGTARRSLVQGSKI